MKIAVKHSAFHLRLWQSKNKIAAGKSPYKTLADLIKFNEDNREREMPLFGQELFLQSEKRWDLTESAYVQALRRLKAATQTKGGDALVTKNNLDAIVSPSFGGTCWSAAVVAGYPYVTVPAGFIDGLPAGIAFFGSAFSESRLIKIAYAFERKTRMRQPPKFPPTRG